MRSCWSRCSTVDWVINRESVVPPWQQLADLLRWPGVPPMFEFKDQDGNTFEIVEGGL